MGYSPYQLVIAGFFFHQEDEERGEASRYHAFNFFSSTLMSFEVDS